MTVGQNVSWQEADWVVAPSADVTSIAVFARRCTA